MCRRRLFPIAAVLALALFLCIAMFQVDQEEYCVCKECQFEQDEFRCRLWTQEGLDRILDRLAADKDASR